MSHPSNNPPCSPGVPHQVRPASNAASDHHTPRHVAVTDAAAKIIFVGGDERQARTSAKLVTAGMPKGMDVRFYHPCWTRNWNKVADDIKRHLNETDAIIITTDVPTLLGAELRHLARTTGLVWLGARARGKGAITVALQDALYLVETR
jgi:hypothetical protein